MVALADLLETIEKEKENRSVARLVLPARPARYAEPAEPLSQPVRERLGGIGVARLYAHQARALDLVRDDQHIIVTTGTASGKSLCYNIPVLEALSANKKARALYIFPTKALAQDQLRALAELDFPMAATYDGDTPPEARAAIKREAAVVLTNPDMLHQGILPQHRQWANFLLNVKYVVVDEAHTLRGVFGSNAALVFRRLRRLCAYYGSNPIFILSSATLGNPSEHASALTGLDVEVIESDGAPRGRKFFLLWNPPLLEEEVGKRLSSTSEASSLLATLAQLGLRTICFSKTRRSAELVLRHAKGYLSMHAELADRIASYRAGYLPSERREIERALFQGELLGVSATNALELGIDVGGLDAAVINGFPGTMTSLWQQAGRAGRRESDAVAVLIAGEDPLDQYYVNHPEYFSGRGIDEAVVDLENSNINARHAACAAYELPLDSSNMEVFGGAFQKAVDVLAENGVLKSSGGKFFYAGREFPAANCSLRGASGAEYIIVEESGELIGTVDEERAFSEVYPGAVYLHRGEGYLIRELDLVSRVALATKGEVDYYTQLRAETNLWIDDEVTRKPLGTTTAHFGVVSVEKVIKGFQKKLVKSGQIAGFTDLELPPSRFQTEAFWFPTPGAEELEMTAEEFAGGLHALEHALIGLLPSRAMCDRWDVGGVSTPLHPELLTPAVFIYDGYAGGIGLAHRCHHIAQDLFEAVLSHLKSCPCKGGCPSCVQSPKCGNLNEPLDKEAAISILKYLL